MEDEALPPAAPPPGETLTDFEAAVVAALARTEPGDVLSYGEVAAEAGRPGAARAVGGVLQRIDGLPWWRVVTAAGRLIPHDPTRQAALLRAEGVTVSGNHVVTDPARQLNQS